MSVVIALLTLSSVYVGRNKQIDDKFKFGFFAVIGVVLMLCILFSALGS